MRSYVCFMFMGRIYFLFCPRKDKTNKQNYGTQKSCYQFWVIFFCIIRHNWYKTQIKTYFLLFMKMVYRNFHVSKFICFPCCKQKIRFQDQNFFDKTILLFVIELKNYESRWDKNVSRFNCHWEIVKNYVSVGNNHLFSISFNSLE